MMTLVQVHVWLRAYTDWERELAAEAEKNRLVAAGQPVTEERAGRFVHARLAAGDALIRLGERLAGVPLSTATAVPTASGTGG